MTHRSQSPWGFVRLGDVAEIRTGVAKNENAPRGSIVRPYLRVANVQDGHLDLTEMKTIQIAEHEIPRYELQVGDVLMTEGGDFDKLGRGTIWRGEVPGCVHQNHVFVVRTSRARLLPEFLALVAESTHGRRYFLRCSKQSTNLASINSTQLRALPVPAAPLDTQGYVVRRHQQIARVEQATARLLDSQRRLKRAVLQQRIACATNWRSVALEKMAAPVVRKNRGASERVLTASGTHGLVDQRTYFNKSVAGVSLDGYYLLKRGEFAYNRSAMKAYPFGAVKRLEDHDEGVVSTLYICFSLTSNRMSGQFLSLLFESGALDRQLRAIVHVGGRAHGLLNVTRDDFFALAIPTPPVDEQSRLCRAFAAFDAEISLLERQLVAYRQLKRGLMQQLLTGQTESLSGSILRVHSGALG